MLFDGTTMKGMEEINYLQNKTGTPIHIWREDIEIVLKDRVQQIISALFEPPLRASGPVVTTSWTGGL